MGYGGWGMGHGPSLIPGLDIDPPLLIALVIPYPGGAFGKATHEPSLPAAGGPFAAAPSAPGAAIMSAIMSGE